MASVAVVALTFMDVAVTSFGGKITASSLAQRNKNKAGINKRKKEPFISPSS